MSVGFTIIGTCVASALKLIRKVRLQGFRNMIFKCNNPVTCLKNDFKFTKFQCYHETTRLKKCPKSFKLVCYKRYVNEIFELFEKPEQVLRFVNYIKLKKIIPFLFSMLRFVEKKINLQQVFPEKIRSVMYALILVAL